jgi:stearoyl-CoA desaturase (Delta-9 desaturase)
MGEGYHNFHHEFPSDYRNGFEWYQYDPTKWMIWICGCIGLAHNLKQFRYNEIEKGRIQQCQKQLDKRGKVLDWGRAIADLPLIEWDEYRHRIQHGEKLVVVEGVVHDVALFMEEHPGGAALIQAHIGKDASAIFNGGMYNHSNAARNLLATMRTASIAGGMEKTGRKKSKASSEVTSSR